MVQFSVEILITNTIKYTYTYQLPGLSEHQ